jgi:Na+/H+-translocating membrane pyrophosphatase
MAKLKIDRDTFRVVFRAVYTLMVSVWVGLYLWHVTFSPAEKVSKFTEFIIGFVLGTLISTLINFYFGGTENATRKTISTSLDGNTINRIPNTGLPHDSETIPGDEPERKIGVDA